MLALITFLLYLSAAGLWLLALSGRRLLIRASFFTGFCAWLMHALLLYRWIDLSAGIDGQNLYVSNVFSLIIWCTLLMVQLLSLKRRKLCNIGMMLLPIAAGSILLVQYLPGDYILDTADNKAQLTHILMAVITFSMLVVALMLAVLIMLQDRLLKRKQVSRLFALLPPLETMEKILFAFIFTGFIGLTLVITGSFLLQQSSGLQLAQTHSPYLAIISWLAFLILLLGRYLAAWRGSKMIVWTMVGVLTLSLSYFGTWLLHGLTH